MKGQTLVEVLLGFAVASVVIAAITITVISSLNNAQRSKNQNTATQYAGEALETMRQFRNNDVDTFRTFGSAGTTKYCFASSCKKLSSDPSCGVLSESCGDNIGIAGFTREVWLTKSSTNCLPPTPLPLTPTPVLVSSNFIMVEAFVRWSDSTCPAVNLYCHQTRLFTCLN